MKRRDLLYYATSGWLALTVVTGVYFLFQSTLPSADVTAEPRSTVYAMSVENFEPGQAKHFRLGNIPVVVWRRNYTQKVEALELLGADFRENPNLLEEIRDIGEIEIESGYVLRFEWFVVSPINTGGHGCIVQPDAGDFGGFYDPCQEVHFDLWGQVQIGATETHLQAIPWSMSDDGTLITVDLKEAPKLE
ncbi:MAG: hypothetical protein ABJP66_20460 [Hyphomicrobiales bacterium]